MELINPILRIRNLTFSYSQIEVLQQIDLFINKGEIVLLAGANGAGKTTLIETIIGLNKPKSGEILFKGEPIIKRSVDSIVRSGIYLVPEGRGVFATMNVLDNLLLGAHHSLNLAKIKLEQVFELFPLLADRRTQIAGTLSGGERQILAIARALMASPEIILIDEPSIGLAPIVVNDVFQIIDKLGNQGYTILLSEQNVHKALKVAHRCYVLERGRVIISGSSKEMFNNKAVVSAYLGV